tara:strand:- start:1779 stop:2495 length:717 start_codon:yes stop_codon:yes gene_type:complete
LKKNIEIVTPVHNEGASIYSTLDEYYTFLKNVDIDIKFVISEDGSTDDTLNEIEKFGLKTDIKLITSKNRKGYSKAVIDGLKETSSDIVCFIDSDGQCDPKDLLKLLEKFNGNNLVIGNRKPRSDNSFRLFISFIFKIFYVYLTKIKLSDPSCPYFISSRKNIEKILDTENIGILKQGFWWEFYARATYLNIDILEVTVNHRKRKSGSTVVFKTTKLPRIAIDHIFSLFKLSKILKNL